MSIGRFRSLLTFGFAALTAAMTGAAALGQIGISSPDAKPGTGKPASVGPILIGHYGSMTGTEATFGQSTDNGNKLAIKAINANGGLKGRMLQHKTYDTQGKTHEAGTAVNRAN